MANHAGSPEPGETGDEEVELARLEHRLEIWNWLLTLVIIGAVSLTEVGLGLDPVKATLFVIGTSLYNTVAFLLLPHWGTMARRIVVHIAFLIIALGFLMSGGGILSPVLLTLLAVAVPVVARAVGPRAGQGMLAMALLVVMLAGLNAWRIGLQGLDVTLALLVIEFLVLLAGAGLGLSNAASLRRLVMELRLSRAATQRQVDRLALLKQINDAVRGSLQIEAILSITVRELGQGLRVDRCYIRLTNEAGDLEPAVVEFTAPGVPGVNTVGVLPPRSIAMIARRVVAVADLSTDQLLRDFGYAQSAAERGIRAAIAAPIEAEGELMGVVVVDELKGPRTWTDEEIRFLEEIASQTAVALVRARTHQTLEDAHEELVAQEEELQALSEAIRESEERYSSLLSIAANAILAVDQSQRIVFFNKQASEVFGYAEEEAVGEPLEILLPQRYAAAHREEIKRFADSPFALRKVEERMELTGRRRSGEEFPVEVAISKFAMGSGMLFTAVVSDITERL